MPPTFERGVEPELENLVRQTEGDDAPAHREDVGVVVLARQAGGVEIVAERGADTGNFVRRHLLALPGAAKHNAAIGASVGYRARDVDADRRIVDRVFAGRAVIVDRVAEPLQRLLQMFFEDKAGVIGADRDAHRAQLYYTLAISAFSSELSAFSDVLNDSQRRHLRARRRASSQRSSVDLPRRRGRRARRGGRSGARPRSAWAHARPGALQRSL